MLHNMKVETLPLGRMALTETIDLVFVKPVKVVKALYDDAYGKHSMRSWKPSIRIDNSDQASIPDQGRLRFNSTDSTQSIVQNSFQRRS